MRRILLLISLLLLSPSIFAPKAAVQSGPPLPNPADFKEVSGPCRRKVKVSPWVGTPGVDWPKTFQCVLAIHTCEGVKNFKSDVRNAGAGMCADYWRVHNALANRTICCDQGTPEKQP